MYRVVQIKVHWKTFHPFYPPPFSPLVCPPYRILRKTCARIYKPSFRENKPKTLVFSHTKRAFWASFRENWVYNFGHWYATWKVLYHTSFRNYAAISLQVPSILSILLGADFTPPLPLGATEASSLFIWTNEKNLIPPCSSPMEEASDIAKPNMAPLLWLYLTLSVQLLQASSQIMFLAEMMTRYT